MPTSTAKRKGYGSTLSVGDDNVTFTPVAGAKIMAPPAKKRARIDVTDLQSPNETREGMAGWLDPGNVPFTLYLREDQYVILDGYLNDGVTRYWKLELPLVGTQTVKAKWVWQGFLSELGSPEISSDGDNALMCQCTIENTGRPTFTPGS